MCGAPRQCRTREHVYADEQAISQPLLMKGVTDEEPLSEEPNLVVHTGGQETEYDSHFDSGFADHLQLDTFLERKFYYGTYSWAIGMPLSVSFKPMEWFLNRPDVMAKLDSYTLFKCDFEIEINVKATKFHVGMIMASVRRGGLNNTVVDITSQKHLITYSQRPRILLDVSTQQQGMIKVPFVYPYPWISLSTTSDIRTPVGTWPTVDIVGFGDLAAVGATTGNAEVSIFVRAKNIKMAGATTAPYVGVSESQPLTLHMRGVSSASMKSTKGRTPPPNAVDEYEAKGPVSKVASVVADAAGKLRDVPYIGKFALATHIASGALGHIASLFGFSRPALIDDPTRVIPRPSDSFALVDGKAVTDKLSLTSKQEVSVDPSVIGLPSIDEMSFNYLKKVETYLTKFEWHPTDTTDTTIFQLVVDPMAEDSVGGATSRYYPTALSFLTKPFGKWRGSLKYRFVMVASKFHAGKLTFSYEPTEGEGGATSDELYQRRQHYVVDLSTDLDVELTVNYQRNLTYCDVVSSISSPIAYFNTNGTSISASPLRTNGTIYVQPYTELTVTDDVTPVKVLVFISAGDDFEVQEPWVDNWHQLTYKPVSQKQEPTLLLKMKGVTDVGSAELGEVSQGDQFGERAATQTILTKDVNKVEQGASPVFYGEKPTSMRQMIKRWCPYMLIMPGFSDSWYMTHRDFPLYRGKDTSGIHSYASGNYDYVCNTYINYLAPAYGFWRGSIRYRFRVLRGNTDEMFEFSASKYNGPLLSTTPQASTIDVTNSSTLAASGVPTFQWEIEGSAIARKSTNDMLDFEVPYYSPMRANLVGLADDSFQQADGYCYGNSFFLDVFDNDKAIFKSSVCAGDDFSFMCFNGAPVCYFQSDPAAV